MPTIKLACIIDDDPIFVYGAKKLMELTNFCNEFLIFSNGKEAISYFENLTEKKEFPDLILLDLNMPVMDGWEFLDSFIKIKPKKNNVTIYIVSSSIDPQDIERAQHYQDVSNYIVKPITQKKLQSILEQNIKPTESDT